MVTDMMVNRELEVGLFRGGSMYTTLGAQAPTRKQKKFYNMYFSLYKNTYIFYISPHKID
jgi:hypothetical protein